MKKLEKHKISTLPDERIMSKILIVRGERVMIDRDLAELYGVTTKRLNEQVKRNVKRFPPHFMFQLTQEEKDYLVANCDHLNSIKYSPYLPHAFTEHGTIMLANVLNSDQAITTGIKVVEVFITMCGMLLDNEELQGEIESVKQQLLNQNKKISLIFDYLKQFEKLKQEEADYSNRKRIGFKRKNEKH